MKHVATILGVTVLLVIGSPVFVWLGQKFVVGYGTYTAWVYGLLAGIGR